MKGIPVVVLGLVGAVLLLAPAGEMASAAVGEPRGQVGLMEEAERLYGERSYARAHEVYGRIDPGELSPEDARWVAFRLADTQWRSEAATKSADSTRLDEARQQLEAAPYEFTVTTELADGRQCHHRRRSAATLGPKRGKFAEV